MIVQRISWREVKALVDKHRELNGQRAINFAGGNNLLDAINPDRHAAASRQLMIEMSQLEEGRVA